MLSKFQKVFVHKLQNFLNLKKVKDSRMQINRVLVVEEFNLVIVRQN